MLIEGFDYTLYSKLVGIFKSISNLFNISKNRKLFQKLIYSNNIFIPNKIYSKLISNEFKEKLNLIYKNVIKQNIKIIPIISNYYPVNLKNVYNPPLAVFFYGDICLNINNKKITYIYNDNLSNFGSKVYKYFDYHIKGKMLRIGENGSDIIIVYENIFEPSYVNISKNSRIIIPYNAEHKKLEVILGISDYLILIEAKYNEKTKNIVNTFLDNGKDILVVPGNIFNKNHYFSNYLIQEGANVLLNKYDIDKYIT